MGILFVFILSITCISFVLSGPPQCVICAYGGSTGKGTFVLNDVPPRCEAILYGGNYFDAEPSDADTAAITELKNCGKIVYMLYMPKCSESWGSIISDLTCLEAYITPMVTYLNKNKIDGVFLAYLELHAGKILDYATKIKTFIDIIKKCAPSTKVGLWVDGEHADKFTDTNLFDFSATKDCVDIYVVDTACSGVLICKADTTATGGRLPLSDIQKICDATAASGMDQAKIIVNLIDIASKSNEDGDDLLSYTDYCTRNDSSLWCVDSTAILYCQVKEFQKIFKGLVISYMDYDDSLDACECDKYPIANTYIDAWENKTLKCCDKIDKV